MYWQPSACLQTIRLRAQLYQTLRDFFAKRQVLEVETPILSAASAPDPMIMPFYTDYHGPEPKRLFLHTSPELAMKRLLAAGSGAIFQITKVFRDGEAGRWHNPEFSLLEWYRPAWRQAQLIDEVEALLHCVYPCAPAQRLSYCSLFEQYTGLHPLEIPLAQLQTYVAQKGLMGRHNRDTCLQWLLTEHIEPQLIAPTVITDFPATQAALAQRRADAPHLAQRFEVYIQGLELANGFYELTDPIEQRQRFEADIATRKRLGLPVYPLDEHFLAALAAGLPPCAGVALGLDRLLMLMTQKAHIRDVLSFAIDNA